MGVRFACESHDSLIRWDEQRQLVVDNAEFLRELRLARVRKVDTRRRFDGEQIRQGRLRGCYGGEHRVFVRILCHGWR